GQAGFPAAAAFLCGSGAREAITDAVLDRSWLPLGGQCAAPAATAAAAADSSAVKFARRGASFAGRWGGGREPSAAKEGPAVVHRAVRARPRVVQLRRQPCWCRRPEPQAGEGGGQDPASAGSGVGCSTLVSAGEQVQLTLRVTPGTLCDRSFFSGTPPA
ncbi:unnamed protein product, partial [Scytosiphon promiscuus]